MTDPEALDIAVTRTGHVRYRQLLDPGHPDHNPGYWPVVREIAGQPAPPPPPPAPTPEDIALQAFVGRHGCGGCGG